MINCQRAVRGDGSNLFSLKEDDMIINTPDVSNLKQQASGDIFKLDDSTPMKKGVFFMQDDFFVDVHEHAEPPMNPHDNSIQEE